MLDVLNGVSPAIVLNDRRDDILGANQLARTLITDFNVLPSRERNLARYVLLEPATRDLYPDWHQVAEIMATNLHLSAARHPDDSQLNELIGELCTKVPEFRTWWASHRVDPCAHGTQRFPPSRGRRADTVP